MQVISFVPLHQNKYVKPRRTATLEYAMHEPQNVESIVLPTRTNRFEVLHLRVRLRLGIQVVQVIVRNRSKRPRKPSLTLKTSCAKHVDVRRSKG